MNPLEKYDIAFLGLKPGPHRFQYTLNRDFMELFDGAPFHECDIEVTLDFVKKPNLFELDFGYSGTAHVECDRCAEPFDYEVENHFQAFVKFKGERRTDVVTDDPDIIFITPKDSHINVANLLYEFAVLSIPMRKTHPENDDGEPQCPPEFEERLARFTGGRTDDGDDFEEGQNEVTDARWEALRKLKDNLN